MSTELSTHNALHLPDLAISGFRGIEDLSISRLGCVTLIAGKNGVGKTTLLDAVRIYAAGGRYPVLADILREREELTEDIDDDGNEILAPNWEALFYGRDISSDRSITIGPSRRVLRLSIATAPLGKIEMMKWRNPSPEYFSDEYVRVFRIEFDSKKQDIPMSFLSSSLGAARAMSGRRSLSRNHQLLRDEEAKLPPEIRCESLGPNLLSDADMARFWDNVALTEDEVRAVQALQLIYGDSVQRVAMIGDRHDRRAVVKIAGQTRPVPLHSLGDGAVRLFGVALALANSQDGFLVIDEAENGIHHSVQRDFWRMVLRTAHENNIQVLATTHSWSCVAGFAQATAELDETEDALVRIERGGDRLHAVEYSKKNLKAAADYGIEVR